MIIIVVIYNKNENRIYRNYLHHIHYIFYGGANPFPYWKEWQTQNAQIYTRWRPNKNSHS